MSCKNPFIIELPPLPDHAVEAIHNWLVELADRFENQYFGQLHRYHRALEAERRQHEPSFFDRTCEDDKPF